MTSNIPDRINNIMIKLHIDVIAAIKWSDWGRVEGIIDDINRICIRASYNSTHSVGFSRARLLDGKWS